MCGMSACTGTLMNVLGPPPKKKNLSWKGDAHDDIQRLICTHMFKWWCRDTATLLFWSSHWSTQICRGCSESGPLKHSQVRLVVLWDQKSYLWWCRFSKSFDLETTHYVYQREAGVYRSFSNHQNLHVMISTWTFQLDLIVCFNQDHCWIKSIVQCQSCMPLSFLFPRFVLPCFGQWRSSN